MSSLNTNWSFNRQQHAVRMDVDRAALQYSTYGDSDMCYKILIYPGIICSHTDKK